MSNWVISFLFAISISTWLYAKTMRNTGNNTKNSLIFAGIIAVIIFALSMLLLGVAADFISGN